MVSREHVPVRYGGSCEKHSAVLDSDDKLWIPEQLKLHNHTVPPRLIRPRYLPHGT